MAQGSASRRSATRRATVVVTEPDSPLRPDESNIEALYRLFGDPREHFAYKIYREREDGDREFLLRVPVAEPQEVDDIEDLIISHVRTHGWGPGRYSLRGLVGTAPRVYKLEPVTIRVGEGPGIAKVPGPDAGAAPLAHVSEVIKVAQQVQSLSGSSDQAKIVSEAIKTAAELTAHANPSGDALVNALLNRKDDGGLERAVTLLTPLFKREDGGLDKAIEMLNNLGLIRHPDDDAEPEKPKTFLEQIEEARALYSLVGGKGVPPEPTVVAVLKVLGPTLGPFFSDIGAALRLWAENLRNRPQVIAASPTAAAPTVPVVPIAVEASTTSVPLGQLIAFVENRASGGEATYQAVLDEFARLIPEGKAFIDQIRGGAMEPTTALNAVAHVLTQEHIALSPAAHDYLSRLFASLKPAQPETHYVCVRKCDACNATVGYVSVDEAKADTQPCPKCGGALASGISETSGSAGNGATP